MGKKVHGVGDCTLECLLTHGRRNGHGPTVISFFKVILDPLSESLVYDYDPSLSFSFLFLVFFFLLKKRKRKKEKERDI